MALRVRFFKKTQDWILKSERIRKRILRFFTGQINPRSFGSRSLKGAEESTPRLDSSVPLIHHDLRDLGLICSVKKRTIRFRILSDSRIQSWIFLKKRTLSLSFVKFMAIDPNAGERSVIIAYGVTSDNVPVASSMTYRY